MVKILLVDDDYNILAAYKRHLFKKFEVVTAESGTDGLVLLKEQGPFSVVVSDFRMPEIDGIQFLSAVRKAAPDTVRVMLTGQADMKAAIDAINKGNLFRFLTKPCPIEDLIKTLNDAVEQYQLIISERELLEKTLKGSIKILMDILSLVNPVAFSQSSRIRNMSRKLAVRLNVENSWQVELAAMLSQIGCVTIPGDILEKRYKGQELTVQEKEIYLSHPQAGKKLLVNIPRLEEIAEAISCQEELYDVRGFSSDRPRGIPLASRILKAVLDYDVLLATGKTPVKSVEAMRSRDGFYDPSVLDALETEANNIKEGFIIRAMFVKDILPGMVLSDDIKDKAGSVLIPKGNEISEVIKARLINFASFGNVVEPIKILEQVAKEN